MNDIRQIELYKSRSYTACIKEALNTFAHNIRVIFFHTWAYALVAAIVMSLYVSSATSIVTNGISVGRTVLFMMSILLLLCVSIAFNGRAVTLVNMQKTVFNIKRVARITLVMVVLYFVIGVIFGVIAAFIVQSSGAAKVPTAASAVSICINAASIIIILALLPYVYVFAKYMYEPGTKLRKLLLKSYRTGFRHWGFIFLTMFLAYLCMAVCAVILALPAVIILSARTLSINGVSTFGDPSGLPAYFDIMQFGLFTLASFVWEYISIFCIFVCFYIYGSIETREKEKKEFLQRS